MEQTDAVTNFAAVRRDRFGETPPVDYLACLQRLSLALANALTDAQAAEAILSEVAAALNAAAGAVCLLADGDTHLEAVRCFGYSPQVSLQYARLPLETPISLADAVRQGEPILLASATEREARYPQHSSLLEACAVYDALVAFPLKVPERVLGAIELVFTAGPLRAEECVFLETAAQMGASTFELIRRRAAEGWARNALKEMDTRARGFFDGFADGFLIMDADGRINYANDYAASASRLPREDLYGKILWDLFPEYVGSPYHDACLQALRDEKAVHREDYWPRFHAWFENNIIPVNSGLAVLFRDITAKKKTDEALRAAESQLRLITDAAPMLISYIDRQERFRFVNRAYADWFGVPVEQIVGKPIREVVSSEAYQAIRGYIRAALAGQIVAYDRAVADGAGRMRHIEAVYIPDIDPEGTVRGLVGIVTDITVRKRSEALKQAVNDLFFGLADLTDPEAILERVVTMVGTALDADGCTLTEVDVEQNRAEILRSHAPGLPSIAGTYPLSDLVVPEWLAFYHQGRTRIVEDTTTDVHAGPVHARSYGPMYIGAFVSVPFLRGGKWVGGLGVYMRRPHHWRPEEIAFLEAVGERAWLSLENARLFQAERERSKQLAFAISEIHHRIKNNLQAVGALLEIQIPDGETLMPVEAVHDSLSQIKAIALVHDLLSKDQPIGMVDAAQVLTNLGKLLSQGMRAGDRPLPIRVKAESAQMPTRIATSLALAVNELLTNAAKHNAEIDTEGGAVSPAAIEVSLSHRNDDIVVIVNDHGPGFPSDFDPNRDANIGLQVVQTLVGHDLQGHITFGNSVGEDGSRIEGARVEIVFPVSGLSE